METSIPGDGDRLDSSENPANDYSWTVNDGLSRTEFHLSPDPSPDRGFESDFDLQFNSDDQPTIPFSLEVATREGHCLPAGSLVGPYKIIRRLGQGGMGTVYEATHSQSGQSVALKLVSKSVRSTEELVERFKRESLIAASINHPRSTFVYHSGQHHDQLYIAMELMTGGTLNEVVKTEGPLPVARAVDYVLDMLSGLQAAHQAGIVHRDLKPSNCFLDKEGRVKIGDFGLSKSFLADSSLTQTGAFMGTPQFAAPEQLRSGDIDERTDIYAIGGTLFFLLTGRAPFIGNAALVIASITSDPAPKLETLVDDIPRELSRIVQLTLEKDPARRPENADALRQSLLPFSSRGTTTPDVGRRMAAFFIDSGVIYIALLLASQFLGVIAQVTMITSFHRLTLFNVVQSFVLAVAYFAIQESRCGTTLGKWLMGMRVITAGNQSPTLMRAVSRASIVPGISYVLNTVPLFFVEFDLQNDPVGLSRTVISLQLIQMLSYLPNVVCFFNAKIESGFRGFHETISGTRVVRLAGALEYRRFSQVPVTLPIAETPRKYGDFQAVGRLGKRVLEGSAVLLGRDLNLDRNVWIIDHANLVPSDWWHLRKEVSRLTRLRILAEHIDHEHRWVVTEAIKGMPLIDYIEQTPNVDWRSFRPLLREIVFELRQGSIDGTLPRTLELANVWVDHDGRAKLLDEPIVPPAVGARVMVTAPRTLTPFELVSGLLHQFIENQVVPEHVLAFRDQLLELAVEPDWLEKTGEQLTELAEKPSAWRWDDRLGVMAISMGLEFSLVGSLLSLMALVASFFLSISVPTMGILVFGITSLIAIVLGGIFLGGLAFLLSGVLVRRNKTLEPASRLRCGIRTWIAWLPSIFIATALLMAFHQLIELDPLEPTLDDVQVYVMAGALLVSFCMIVCAALTAIYSIWRPSRGIADLLAGTRLIRK